MNYAGEYIAGKETVFAQEIPVAIQRYLFDEKGTKRIVRVVPADFPETYKVVGICSGAGSFDQVVKAFGSFSKVFAKSMGIDDPIGRMYFDNDDFIMHIHSLRLALLFDDISITKRHTEWLYSEGNPEFRLTDLKDLVENHYDDDTGVVVIEKGTDIFFTVKELLENKPGIMSKRVKRYLDCYSDNRVIVYV